MTFANGLEIGAPLGAGILAYAQNRFDYRIDEFFLEYVLPKIVAVFYKIIGKKLPVVNDSESSAQKSK